MSARLISHTEITTAMTCWAKHAFAYTGHLTDGSTLKQKELAPILGDGRAWGAAVAAWHRASGGMFPLWEAHEALRASLKADEAEMADRGFPVDVGRRVEAENRLGAMLDHYSVTAEPLPNLTRLEGEIVVPLPSRSGSGRSSTRYRFQCFLDGYTAQDGQQWIVEFKLRGRLTEPALLERQRQPPWYAWSLGRVQGGHRPTGVIVDERLNAVPNEPKINKNGKPSHDKAQVITSQSYVEACLERDEQPKMEVVASLDQRAWQQRFPLMLSQAELDTAGLELVSAAQLIRDLDSGQLTPIRNATRSNCQSCRYSQICANPQDHLLVDSLFERTVPKRLREPAPQPERTT